MAPSRSGWMGESRNPDDAANIQNFISRFATNMTTPSSSDQTNNVENPAAGMQGANIANDQGIGNPTAVNVDPNSLTQQSISSSSFVNPTSVNPTSINPTSVNPTSVNPTSVNPTSVNSTSVNPTSVNPTSVNPTSVNPTSVNSTSVNPTSVNPTSVNPTSVNPTSVNPSNVNPSNVNPSNVNPSNVNPSNAAVETVPSETSASNQTATSAAARFGSAMEDSRFYTPPGYLQSTRTSAVPRSTPAQMFSNNRNNVRNRAPTGFQRLSRREHLRLRQEEIDRQIRENRERLARARDNAKAPATPSTAQAETIQEAHTNTPIAPPQIAEGPAAPNTASLHTNGAQLPVNPPQETSVPVPTTPNQETAARATNIQTTPASLDSTPANAAVATNGTSTQTPTTGPVRRAGFRRPAVRVVNNNPYRNPNPAIGNNANGHASGENAGESNIFSANNGDGNVTTNDNGEASDVSTRCIKAVGVNAAYNVERLMELGTGRGAAKRKVESVTLSMDASGIRTSEFRFTSIADAMAFKAELDNGADLEGANITFA